ncbi:TetR/AcrR family transcriptional regulator [Kribbella sp. NBC_01245]|uniref:TetR/AcrR family transcriptional regulator n=1 Tax=Kribbella sp. NBC_01245 TaxID=2903578 RepID=UPI002E2C06D9|nr:TetR/AcrR family transcriptional regulator [Kribbella sp. NBC_01245]
MKRQRTREAISSAAITLFLERGFAAVSVADVAAAAQVSKPTLFKYFPTKQDLALDRIADHEREAARVVRERESGEDPIQALRRHFLANLESRDPVTGLNDHPVVLAYHRLVFTTPELASRVLDLVVQDEEALAESLIETYGELAANVRAAQVVATQRVLARRNWQALADGSTAAERYPVAVTEASEGFDLLG